MSADQLSLILDNVSTRSTRDEPLDTNEVAELKLLLQHVIDRTVAGLTQVNAANASSRRQELRRLQMEAHCALADIDRALPQSE